MTVVIELEPGVRARITVDRWYASNPWIARILNREEREYREFEFPSHTPMPELTSARHMIGVFGGRITSTRNQLVLRSEFGKVY